jgi:cytochrome c peroxidase
MNRPLGEVWLSLGRRYWKEWEGLMKRAQFVLVSALPLVLAVGVAMQDSPVGGLATTVEASGRGHNNDPHDSDLDRDLRRALHRAGFTGDIQREFDKRLKKSLGRPIDKKLAELGRLLWFDNLPSLGGDNTCGGCHGPANGFGDSQPMAIGVLNNNLVGPNRTGPRNQRRSPMVVNSALYPRLMWNDRFESLSGDPFDGSAGFRFPEPEGDTRFSPEENALRDVRHLLQAQAHLPPTELIEVGGFEDICTPVPQPGVDPRLCVFDVDGPGQPVPLPDSSGFRNESIRQLGLQALNANPTYRRLFGQVFREVKHGAPIDFFMFGKAIAEFEFTLVFADAPLDQFARGRHNAMSTSEKRGAVLFFGKAGCVSCHRVDGKSNEMFSDFQEHVVGVPQVFPQLGWGTGNFIFSGPGENEDFGREERSGDPNDRYKFRTAPLRNLALSPGFFHNGAFVDLEDAIRFHLNVVKGAQTYDPDVAGIPLDLRQVGPLVPKHLVDPRLRKAIKLSASEVEDLVRFVRTGLLDDRALPENLCGLVPRRVPSGLPVAVFEGCTGL